MTKIEFIQHYKDIPVVFDNYYKYTFTFKGTLSNGDTITCSCGGVSDDIYRFEVISGKEILISTLDPYKGSIIRDGKELDDFYEWMY